MPLWPDGLIRNFCGWCRCSPTATRPCCWSNVVQVQALARGHVLQLRGGADVALPRLRRSAVARPDLDLRAVRRTCCSATSRHFRELTLRRWRPSSSPSSVHCCAARAVAGVELDRGAVGLAAALDVEALALRRVHLDDRGLVADPARRRPGTSSPASGRGGRRPTSGPAGPRAPSRRWRGPWWRPCSRSGSGCAAWPGRRSPAATPGGRGGDCRPGPCSGRSGRATRTTRTGSSGPRPRSGTPPCPAAGPYGGNRRRPGRCGRCPRPSAPGDPCSQMLERVALG